MDLRADLLQKILTSKYIYHYSKNKVSAAASSRHCEGKFIFKYIENNFKINIDSIQIKKHQSLPDFIYI